MFRSLPFPRRKPRNCHLESDRIDTCTAFPISGVNIDPLSVATQLTSLCKVPCLVATLGHVTMTTQFRLRVDSLELSYGKDWKWGHTDRDSWKMVKMMYEFLCILLLCKEHTKLPNGTKEKLLANRKSSEWFCEWQSLLSLRKRWNLANRPIGQSAWHSPAQKAALRMRQHLHTESAWRTT